MMVIPNKVLVFAAHQDDETIGCGGAIYRHYLKGDEVYCLSFTDGVSARDKVKKKDLKNRINSSIKASKILKFKWVENKKLFEDNKLDSYPLLDLVKVIEKVKNRINPDIVYTHYFNDLNVDHKAVSMATITAFRPLKKEKCKEILMLAADDMDYKTMAEIIKTPIGTVMSRLANCRKESRKDCSWN